MGSRRPRDRRRVALRGRNARSDSGRRSADELDALAERLAAAVSAKPGTTMLVLASEVGATVRELERPAYRLKKAGRIRTVGERNATRYFPLPTRKSAA